MKKTAKPVFYRTSRMAFVAVLGLIFSVSSCMQKKNIAYFQGNSAEGTQSLKKNYTPTFHIDDLLTITVAGGDVEVAAPFNLPVAANTTFDGRAAGVPQMQTYLIDELGMIDFPVVGKIKIAGISRVDAILLLKEKLKPYLSNPIVNIKILNYKVTVLGEVARPGTFTIPNERLSLPEALGMAGDLTIWGNRKNILVVRDKDGVKTEHRIDLTSKEIFGSEVFYLQQNDVIYVEPNKAKINSAAVGTQTSLYISATSLLITVIALILR